jgi:osmotically-inducible protein OsmY
MSRCMPSRNLALALLACLFGCGDQTASSTITTPPASSLPQSGSGAEIDRPRPDNSVANKSDGQEALTPMSQGASAADTQETATIRKAIMADPMLSVDAQNIKIITLRGQVTLRGVVDSVDEHKRVCQIVQKASGTDVYDDQLRVK